MTTCQGRPGVRTDAGLAVSARALDEAVRIEHRSKIVNR
jgi:hypothetical protein